MKQFLVCWDRGISVIWVFDGFKWRTRTSKGWRDSKSQDWLPVEFDHALKVNNFKEK